MKRQIRFGVFETNSSSTHSLQICSKEDFDSWKMGKLYFLDGWRDSGFFTEEELMEIVKNDYHKKLYKGDGSRESVLEYFKGDGMQSFDEYFDDEYLEIFEEYYTTKGGEEIVAFGKYGWDG